MKLLIVHVNMYCLVSRGVEEHRKESDLPGICDLVDQEKEKLTDDDTKILYGTLQGVLRGGWFWPSSQIF